MSKSKEPCEKHNQVIGEVNEQFEQIERTKALKVSPKLKDQLADINIKKIDSLILEKCYSCSGNGECKQ
jgi:hypothetical protein